MWCVCVRERCPLDLDLHNTYSVCICTCMCANVCVFVDTCEAVADMGHVSNERYFSLSCTEFCYIY